MRSNYLPTKPPSVFALIVIISVAAVGGLLYTPALPEIGDYFGVSSPAVQSTIMVYLAAYSIGQLLYGPLANRVGRKRALYIGISSSVLGCLLCVWSAYFHLFWLLILGRVIMALGAASGLALALAIVADCFPVDTARRVVAYVLMAFAIVPGIAIAIGGQLVTHWGWRSCFYFLMFYNIAVLVLCHRLPETGAELDKSALSWKVISSRYRQTFCSPHLLAFAFMGGAATAMNFAFNTIAPVLGIEVIRLTPSTYGLLILVTSVLYISGNVVAAKLAKTHSVLFVMWCGYGIMTLGVVLMWVTFLTALGWPVLILCPSVLYFGIALVYSNATAVASTPMPDKPTATATFSFINIGTAFVTVLVAGTLNLHNVVVLPAVLTVLLAVSVVLLFTRKMV